MQPNDPIQLRSEFALHAKDRHRKAHEHLQNMLRNKRVKREAEDDQNDFVDLVQMIMASDESITRFQDKIDEFRNNTVQNILDYQNQLDELKAEKAALLGNAHVLPDGRHVFRTEDGKNVFDEEGHKVDPDVITPSKISAKSTSWDHFSANRDETDKVKSKLNKEVTTLEKIDELQVELDNGKPTADKLKELNEQLDGLMAGSLEQEYAIPDPSSEAPATKNDSLFGPIRNSGMFN